MVFFAVVVYGGFGQGVRRLIFLKLPFTGGIGKWVQGLSTAPLHAKVWRDVMETNYFVVKFMAYPETGLGAYDCRRKKIIPSSSKIIPGQSRGQKVHRQEKRSERVPET